MRFVRFKLADLGGNDEMKGLLEADGQIRRIYGSYLQAFSVTEQVFQAADVVYLPPILPMTILCDDDAVSYVKSPASLVGTGATVEIPANLDKLFYTARIGWVVKNRDYNKFSGATIFGFTHMLDFSVDDSPSALDSSNGFTVLGRAIDTDLNAAPVPLASFADRIKVYSEQISFRPGDIIAFSFAEKKSCTRGERVSYRGLEVYVK